MNHLKIASRLLLCFLLAFQSVALAAKPPLVLLPVQGDGISAKDRENYRIALQESLSLDYEVFSGAVVQQKLAKSSSKTCNANECLQEVAITFQGELIGRLAVTPDKNGYLLALEIKNIFDDKVLVSQNIPCEGCNNYAVVQKLRELDLAMNSTRKTKKEDEGIAWYWWVLGAVVIGAAVSGGGGDDSSDEPAATQETGTVTVNWN